MLPYRDIPSLSPTPDKRFGHTITLVNKDRAILFGGAIGEGNYTITNSLFSFDCRTNEWTSLKPRNADEGPSPRAAHAATTVQANQMVVFGGSQSNGFLADNELYLLKLSSTEANGKWVKVPVPLTEPRPSARYGHVMVFFKPFIVIHGGNLLNEPNSEVWTLSIDKSPFLWNKLEIDGGPKPRVYHAASMWKTEEMGDMMLVFGGRDPKGEPMNDMWGLRRHKTGAWSWIIAPAKEGSSVPSERYQHSVLCTKNLVLVVGGRNTKDTSLLPLDVYNLETSSWCCFPGINRFRHVNWICGSLLYTYGGFESIKPSASSDALNTVELCEVFAQKPEMLKNLEPATEERPSLLPPRPPREGELPQGRNLYTLNKKITVAEMRGDEGLFNLIDINQLQQEGVKIVDDHGPEPVNQSEEYTRQVANNIIKTFLKSLDFRPTENAPFPMKPEAIGVLCDLAIKALKVSPTLIHLRAGVKIFGSIHGQMGDLLRFFKQYGVPDDDFQFERKSDIEALDYLFLGNYVDRGTNSLEVICLLLALKLKFPAHIHLLRGSHEDRKINQAEGLFTECQMRLKEDPAAPQSVFNKLNEVFEYLSYAAVIANKIFCVHSGIGLNLRRLDQIEKLRKPFTIHHNELGSAEQKIVFDMLWSDPVLDNSETQNRVNEHRDHLAQGTIVRFGTERISQFLSENNLQIIVRSHEPVIDGADEFGNSSLYTIFSCSDYCGITNNDAAIFLHHKHTKQLITYTLKNVKGNTKWYNLTQTRKSQTLPKREENELKDRPVTPVRRVARST